MSLKGGIKTAMLREAYKGDQLIDRDPLLEINDNFIELLAEGHKQRKEELNLKKQAVKKDTDTVSMTNSTLNDLILVKVKLEVSLLTAMELCYLLPALPFRWLSSCESLPCLEINVFEYVSCKFAESLSIK
ncbi:putative plant organelle RNA recognition domain-containing protein [Helianthus debilis subsp. tardiflorus]